jgi:hypothetical protein
MRRNSTLLAFLAVILLAAAVPNVAHGQACSNTTVESGGAYRAQRADNYENIDDLCDAVLTGVGAKNGAAVTVVEYGDNAVHKSVFTLTALSVTMTDAGAAGSHGGFKLYDFPAGAIGRLGCSWEVTITAGAGGIADGAAVVGSLGQVVAGTDNATLTSTEADFIASTAGTLTTGAGVLEGTGAGSLTLLDGHTTPIDLFLNLAVPDADSSASDTVAVSGTVTCTWLSVGDWT